MTESRPCKTASVHLERLTQALMAQRHDVISGRDLGGMGIAQALCAVAQVALPRTVKDRLEQTEPKD